MNQGSQPAGIEPRRAIIQSVERAAVVLRAFSVSRPRLSLGELTDALGVSKPTAHRYTKSLRAVNLLRYDPVEMVFSLSPDILTLASVAKAGLPVIDVAGPFMNDLLRRVNETVVLSVWDGEAPMVVRVADNTDKIVRISISVGSRLDPINSAQSRVFRAHLAYEAETLGTDGIDTVPELDANMRQILETGLAANTPALSGVRSVAAPVFQDGRIVASMALVGTVPALDDSVDALTSKELKAAAEALSKRIGERADNGSAPHDADDQVRATPETDVKP
jgi:IclR family pca regulon transcriptional regulator